MRRSTTTFGVLFLVPAIAGITVFGLQQVYSKSLPASLTAKERIFNGPTKVPVPNLTGLTFVEATNELKTKGLSVGAVIVFQGETDSISLQSLKVYRQLPSAKNERGIQNFIGKGKHIDVWLELTSNVADTSKKVNRVVGRSQVTQ